MVAYAERRLPEHRNASVPMASRANVVSSTNALISVRMAARAALAPRDNDCATAPLDSLENIVRRTRVMIIARMVELVQIVDAV